ncbi:MULTISPECIES: DUF4123 domain-containing protein [Pseudomonas]|jgi:hypothetical protein|uniref:DUF4123 domain-containing protein n=1 Tax=Pseudomonas TaxID=286 RepID=UPI000876CAFD|nr:MULTISPECIES: DUF4123 domain-containing protein [Pseudomonas]MDB6445068.1 DUF4123 domain-containing protein [Pseudomonas sp. 21TX0197]MDT8907563.1 DUF4123 domain-containing protein [Pseudomonas prosekii]NHN70249.1 DUF4123 domain-containing protein [Pseudomonas fluorescens]ROO39174.1 hypothetical protein BIV08_18090 [Pseudomonas sp. AF76]ROO39486.1 hypothetical protein BIV09_12410 [Pseudomonas sp. 7SR1]
MSAVAMSGSTPQWLLLDLPGAPGAARLLHEQFAEVRRFALFEQTEWHGLREHGPLLVDLQQSPALAGLCHLDPDAWPGLLLVSASPVAQLLAHLRRMLAVTLGLHHKALLSYYNPHTASYFFDGCDPAELSCWLGPISLMRWFGGTWADRAIGSQGWQQLSNPGLPVGALENEHSLSIRQQNKLQQCLLERHAWQWSCATRRDYRVLWEYLEQGLKLGFTEREVLDGWLWLRLQYPDARPVPELRGESQHERLEYLRRSWQNGEG